MIRFYGGLPHWTLGGARTNRDMDFSLERWSIAGIEPLIYHTQRHPGEDWQFCGSFHGAQMMRGGCMGSIMA